MKVGLLLMLTCASVFAQDYRIVGYTCPNGYYFRTETGLCHLTGAMGEQKVDSVDYQHSSKAGVPETVKRRMPLNKKAILDLMDGNYIKEEPSESDLRLTE